RRASSLASVNRLLIPCSRAAASTASQSRDAIERDSPGTATPRSLSAAGVLVPPEGPSDGPGEFPGVLRYRAGALVDGVHTEGEVLSRYRERRLLREGWPFHQKVHRVEADVHHRRPEPFLPGTQHHRQGSRRAVVVRHALPADAHKGVGGTASHHQAN